MNSIRDWIKNRFARYMLDFCVKSYDDIRYSVVWLAVFELVKLDSELSLDSAFNSASKVARAFLFPKELDIYPIEFYKDLSLLEKLTLVKLRSNTKAKLAYNLYELIQGVYWFDKGKLEYKRLRENKDKLKRVKKYCGEVKVYHFIEFNKEVKALSKETKSQSRKLIRERGNSRIKDLVGDISFDLNIILAVISVVSTLGLLAGVLYNNVFFSGLGIEASEIMTASDYIYMSLPTLGHSFFIVFVLFLAWMFSVRQELREYCIDEDFGVEKERKTDWTKALSFIMLCSIFAFNYFVMDKVLHLLIPAIFVYIYSTLTPKLGVLEHFKRPIFVFYSVLVVCYLFLNVNYRAKSDLDNYYTMDVDSLYEVVLVKSIDDKYIDYAPLKVTSNNIILFNKNNKSDIVVLPKSSVESYRYLKTDEQEVYELLYAWVRG